MEREFIMIKPDGVHRALIGETVARIERAGLKIIGLKMLQISRSRRRSTTRSTRGRPSTRV